MAEAAGMEMTPWEQHSAVIKLPRFDYNAPSSLLHNSHSEREKSATKEAMSILHKFLAPAGYHSSNNPIESTTSKRRKTCAGDECLDNKETDSAGDVKHSNPVKDGVDALSLVKLTRNGLLLLTFPSNAHPDTVHIVSNIIHAIESRSVTLPVKRKTEYARADTPQPRKIPLPLDTDQN